MSFAALSLFTATPRHPVTIYYCKANLKTGNTVRITQDGAVFDCPGVLLKSTRPSGTFTAEMIHGNSNGKARASGARCVLIVTDGIVTAVAPVGSHLIGNENGDFLQDHPKGKPKWVAEPSHATIYPDRSAAANRLDTLYATGILDWERLDAAPIPVSEPFQTA